MPQAIVHAATLSAAAAIVNLTHTSFVHIQCVIA
jgi:hypothetical protein